MMPDDDVLTMPSARRIEVFTGAGRRRRWSDEAKAQIVAESYSTSVGEAADRHGLCKTQLFTWRRDARQPLALVPPPLFTPVVVEAAPTPAPAERRPVRRKSRRSGEGGIELEIDGVTVRVDRGAEAKTVAAIIRALKAAR
jgi:transposase